MIINDAHQSGHAAATKAQRTNAVVQISKDRQVFGMTEALHVGPPTGWASSAGESRIYWDKKVFSRDAYGTISIPTGPWKRGTSTRTSVEFPWVHLVEKACRDNTVLRIVSHLPAHLTDKHQLAANLEAIEGAPDAILRIWNTYFPSEMTLSMDANRDVRLARNRKLLEDNFGDIGLHLIAPPAGTFGQRKIDPILSTTGLFNKGMFDPIAGLDHTGWWVDYHACDCG